MSWEEYRRRGGTIIRCSVEGCERPAVELDPYWPYFNEGNLCVKHAGGRRC